MNMGFEHRRKKREHQVPVGPEQPAPAKEVE
jgi:hypothetical protein